MENLISRFGNWATNLENKRTKYFWIAVYAIGATLDYLYWFKH